MINTKGVYDREFSNELIADIEEHIKYIDGKIYNLSSTRYNQQDIQQAISNLYIAKSNAFIALSKLY